MKTSELLRTARAKIEDAAHWIQEAYALGDEDGDNGAIEVKPNSPSARCWCATGAIASVQDYPEPNWHGQLRDAFNHRSDGDIENFNDSHTHAQVLALYDEAIARAEATQ